ncbi:hypothetical protein NPIL_229231 [Nephila pilipes]|uniref:Uncharacterized protein n=1 Tax=Nephila pilipes TaxID=299642 RepID=A0A8X6QWL3_NEPPI|nr:hypothetical protein NPIL_229231 [Nephila pilipes]
MKEVLLFFSSALLTENIFSERHLKCRARASSASGFLFSSLCRAFPYKRPPPLNPSPAKYFLKRDKFFPERGEVKKSLDEFNASQMLNERTCCFSGTAKSRSFLRESLVIELCVSRRYLRIFATERCGMI